MTIHFPDIASYQTGFPLDNIPAVFVKATEGADYVNPDFSRVRADARTRNLPICAYHYLRRNDPPGQAAHAYRLVWADMPLMLDIERVSGTEEPTAADALSFVDEYRRLGGRCPLYYLPRWYWRDLGMPDLRPFAMRGMGLISSLYTPYTDDGPGWQGYGGVDPVIWQWADDYRLNGYAVDMNAFRGTVTELRALLEGDDMNTEQDRLLYNLDRLNTALLTGADTVTGVRGDDGQLHDYPLQLVKDIEALKASKPSAADLSVHDLYAELGKRIFGQAL
jgi:hypothetical protein